MTAPNPRDTDPLVPTDVDEAYADGFVAGVAHAIATEPAHRVGTRVAVAMLIAAAFALGVVAHAVLAARPGTSEALAAQASAGGGSSAASLVPGVPHSVSAAAPQPSVSVHDSVSVTGPTPTEPPAIASGLASYVRPSLGAGYLALPVGPGHRVRICSAHGCIVRTSTDAGPALFEQRRGRVADLSFSDFHTLCGGCDPKSVGLLVVSIEDVGGATPPPTTTLP